MCESDIPKKCFSATFCADDHVSMDYFNCKSCKINCEIVSDVGNTLLVSVSCNSEIIANILCSCERGSNEFYGQ